MRPLTIIAAAAVLSLGAGPAAPGDAAGPPVTRTDLQRHDLSIRGRETIQTRIDFPPGSVAPRHTHPGEEIIYVLAGTLQYQVADGAWQTFEAGNVLFIPKGTIHSARNIGSAGGAELATYVIGKGKPLVVLAR